jgi:DNA-binding MarR family transcriptional regulator
MTDDAAEFADLAQRPGFLIRRLHQIHLALFAEECGGFNVTPVQFSILSAAAAKPDLEQARLAVEIGVDRATLANVLIRLEARGLLQRQAAAQDRRVKRIRLTAAGLALLQQMQRPAARAHARTIEALPAPRRAALVATLRRLVDAGNAHGRAPLRLD